MCCLVFGGKVDRNETSCEGLRSVLLLLWKRERFLFFWVKGKEEGRNKNIAFWGGRVIWRLTDVR